MSACACVQILITTLQQYVNTDADSGHEGVLCAGRVKPQRWDGGGGIAVNHQLNISPRLFESFPYKDQRAGDAAIQSGLL